MKQLLDINKHDAQVIHDTGDGKLHVENRFDCQPALDAAARAREVAPDPKSGMKHIAEIPMWLIHVSIREGWFHDNKKWRAIIAEHSKLQVHKD